MRRTSYYEDWSETNPNEFDYDAIDERLGLSTEKRSDDGGRDILPCNFDSSLFDCEQQEYIAEYLVQYRKEVAQRILDFVISPSKKLNRNSERNRKSTIMKIACRAVLFNKLLNDPKVGYRDLPEVYGISNHLLYDERKAILEELSEWDKNISYVICNNRTLQ